MACPNTTFGSWSRLSTRDNWMGSPVLAHVGPLRGSEVRLVLCRVRANSRRTWAKRTGSRDRRSSGWRDCRGSSPYRDARGRAPSRGSPARARGAAAPLNYRLRRRHGAGVGRGRARDHVPARTRWLGDDRRLLPGRRPHRHRLRRPHRDGAGGHLPARARWLGDERRLSSGRAPPPSTTTRRGCEAAAFGSTKKNALDWPMARFRFVEVDFGERSAYFV